MNVYEVIIWYKIFGFSNMADGISIVVAIINFSIIVS